MSLHAVRCCLLGCLLSIAAASFIGCGKPHRRSPPVAETTEIKAVGGTETAAPLEVSADDWPQWRGPHQDGVASGGVPTKWSATENIAWKSAIPGRGHSSPIIVGDRIYLETADESRQIQSVLCLNRADGSQLWQTEIHRGKFETAMHPENTQASSTLAWDGSRLFALFLNDRKIWITALDADGRRLWQTQAGEFASKFGYSASPALFEDFCLVAADHSSGGFLAAVHRQTGAIVWRKGRDRGDSYASPRVIMLGGKPQVILGGIRQVVSYDPRSGDQLWAAKGTAEAVVGTAVASNDLVFASGGYPEAETMAIKPDGSIAWRKNVKSYVPSLLAYDRHVYLANDEGVVICFEDFSGKEKWKRRVGGNFRVSPLLAGDNIYITDMSAKTTVFKASPEHFEAVAENQLGTEAFASPAASRGQLFLRVADSSGGSRQEFLYCIGPAETKVSSSP
jgi:outer membrane protein assembly factor BamB